MGSADPDLRLRLRLRLRAQQSMLCHTEAPLLDPMGKDAILFPFAAGDDHESMSAQFVGAARTWFDSMW